jgi:hypothetical protein
VADNLNLPWTYIIMVHESQAGYSIAADLKKAKIEFGAE